MHRNARRRTLIIVGGLLLAGCASSSKVDRPSVESVLRNPTQTRRHHQPAAGKISEPLEELEVATASGEAVIATVNGRPISRERLVELLLLGHGASLLEQLAVLEAAEGRAADLGVRVTEEDLQSEYDRALSRLSPALVGGTSAATLDPANRTRAEELLAAYLADRNISRAEYDLAIRRNAFLRALALREWTVSEEELAAEFETLHGPKVEVRHIQVASLREAGRLVERLRNGESFEELARALSANVPSAAQGGLLPAFSAKDQDVPSLLREAAFALQPGAVSNPIRLDPWYHVLRLERRIPAEETIMKDDSAAAHTGATGGSPALGAKRKGSARAEAERRLRERLLPVRMEQLYRRFLDEAEIHIEDPILRETYRKTRGNS